MASGGVNLKNQTLKLPKNAPKYLVMAAQDIGTYEAITRNGKKVSNPKVVEWIERFTGSKASSLTTPWCAYWLCAKLEDAGWPSTRSGLARSFLNYGTKIDHKDDRKWKIGDIGIIWRGKQNDGWSGHVFFIVGWTKTTVIGLGGNQGDAVSLQSFPRSKLLGVVRPKPLVTNDTVASTSGAIANEVAVKPVIDNAIPEPASQGPSAGAQAPSGGTSVEDLINTAERTRDWLDGLAQIKPTVMFILSAITVALMLYSLYSKWRDWKRARTT